VDSRIEFANRHGLVQGIAIAWGDKREVEPFAWRRFSSLEARVRYAHGEVRTRDNATEEELFREFDAIGTEFADADPHGRMLGIHPMTAAGSVRELW